MKCPVCGADTRVLDTRKYETTVVRVRQCPNCLHACRSFEVWDPNIKIEISTETYHFDVIPPR
jgi:transcriptional regulator NrdR family protein